MYNRTKFTITLHATHTRKEVGLADPRGNKQTLIHSVHQWHTCTKAQPTTDMDGQHVHEDNTQSSCAHSKHTRSITCLHNSRHTHTVHSNKDIQKLKRVHKHDNTGVYMDDMHQQMYKSAQGCTHINNNGIHIDS